MAEGSHPFPFRTRKLSLPAPMVLGERSPGRVGRRRISHERPLSSDRGLFAFSVHSVRPAAVGSVARWPERTTTETTTDGGQVGPAGAIVPVEVAQVVPADGVPVGAAGARRLTAGGVRADARTVPVPAVHARAVPVAAALARGVRARPAVAATALGPVADALVAVGPTVAVDPVVPAAPADEATVLGPVVPARAGPGRVVRADRGLIDPEAIAGSVPRAPRRSHARRAPEGAGAVWPGGALVGWATTCGVARVATTRATLDG